MATPEELGQAFDNLTKRVVTLAQGVNTAREKMQQMIDQRSNMGVINTNGTRGAQYNGASIRDYENELESLKDAIKNHPANGELQHDIQGAKHYIRALEVEFDHGDGDSAPEYRITGVVLRGLISVSPNDGNQQPNYSSKSSSSMVT